jgi:DNA-binding transcriptional MerR regulator
MLEPWHLNYGLSQAMSKTDRLLTIGELASATGVPTSTLRFWERRGLLEPDRRVGGKRRYTEESRLQVALLRTGQQAAMTLAELRAFNASLCHDWRDVLRKKLADVERRRGELERAHAMLSHAVACPHENLMSCPNFRRQLEAITPS